MPVSKGAVFRERLASNQNQFNQTSSEQSVQPGRVGARLR